jgi:hypothetical protein
LHWPNSVVEWEACCFWQSHQWHGCVEKSWGTGNRFRSSHCQCLHFRLWKFVTRNMSWSRWHAWQMCSMKDTTRMTILDLQGLSMLEMM